MEYLLNFLLGLFHVSNLSILECKSYQYIKMFFKKKKFLIYPYWNVNKNTVVAVPIAVIVSNLSILECKLTCFYKFSYSEMSF